MEETWNKTLGQLVCDLTVTSLWPHADMENDPEGFVLFQRWWNTIIYPESMIKPDVKSPNFGRSLAGHFRFAVPRDRWARLSQCARLFLPKSELLGLSDQCINQQLIWISGRFMNIQYPTGYPKLICWYWDIGLMSGHTVGSRRRRKMFDEVKSLGSQVATLPVSGWQSTSGDIPYTKYIQYIQYLICTHIKCEKWT